MASQDLARDFDLKNLPASFYDDPFPFYDALREHAPIKRFDDGAVLLTRFADVQAVYQQPELFRSNKTKEFAAKFGRESRLYQHHTTSLVFNDPPYHTRIRRTIVAALMPRALSPLQEKLEWLVKRLLDKAQEKGTFDAISDFAAAIPIEVIGDLLDLPMSGRTHLRTWSLAILGALEPLPSVATLAFGEQALAEFHDYLARQIAERRAKPGDPEHDVLTRLILSAGTPLTAMELVENCIFLLNAGHETTTNLIGNAIELFTRFEGAREHLFGQPQLLRSAIEEVLRYESPNQLGNRVTARPTEIGNQTLAADTFVTLGIGAANRDPVVFDKPALFDIARNPNRHLAFAIGSHQCAGMNLAKMEARIALSAFFERFPKYRIAGNAARNQRARFRGFTSLPVNTNLPA
jgi:hypothetical protein